MADAQRDAKGHFLKGVVPATAFKKGQPSAWKGKHPSVETRAKMSAAKKGKPLGYYSSPNREEIIRKNAERMRGAGGPNWKGGITSIHQAIRNSSEYKKWRKAVLARDGECIFCGEEENLQVDHIKPFAYFPELRFEVSNGRVLCRKCHEMTDTFGARAVKLMEQHA